MSSKTHSTFSFLALTWLSFKISIVVKLNINVPISPVVVNSKPLLSFWKLYLINHRILWNCSFQYFSEMFFPFLTLCYVRPLALLKTRQTALWCLHRLSREQMFTVENEWMNEWVIILSPKNSYDFLFFSVLKPQILGTAIKWITRT